MLFIISLLSLIINSFFISYSVRENSYDDLNLIPGNRTGLLLGTSRYLSKGNLNPYFTNRIDAVVKLYNFGKIKYIIASGDNSEEYYNEPKVMRDVLVKRGVPINKIYLDYAGFRTLDSIIRCKKIFKQDKFTIISQKFHNERALFIAEHFNIDAIAFNAKDVKGKNSVKTKVREIFARVKAFLDLYILNKQPKFLGKEIIIK